MSDLASQTSSQTPVGSSSLGKDEPASAIGRNSGSFSDDDPTFSIVAFFKFAGPGIIMCTAFIVGLGCCGCRWKQSLKTRDTHTNARLAGSCAFRKRVVL